VKHALHERPSSRDRAFITRTRKVTKLFQEFEIKLADSLPEGLLAHLVLGDSPVIFYSDLPYEWTLLDNFPICLTRPVSRIPVAAMFVGRLLTDVYSPHPQMNFKTFSDVFFVSQLTTALLYDPLFPLLRRAQPHTRMSEALYRVILDYSRGVSSGVISPRDFRYKAAEILSECLQTHGLLEQYLATVKSGEVIPETLLFTAFGIPTHVELERNEKSDS
jgi:hypothetical protein